MSKIIATVNEGTRLTNGRIRKFIPDLAVWAVPGLLIDVKANGPRTVNGVRVTYVDAAQPLNTNSTFYGVFIISELDEPTEPAVNPVEFDTKLAELHKAHDVAIQLITATQNKIHSQAGDKQRFEGRRRVWGLKLDAATEIVQRQAAQQDTKALALLSSARTLIEQRDELAYDIDRANEIYRRAPWSRFFPSDTKSHPHIHATLGCRTLHIDTVVTWSPSLSGTTEAEAVAQLDEALCSVCFPSAPVALHNYTSKRSQAERDARTAEKDARDAKRAAKELTEDEEFRTGGRDRVTTVAECLRLIRKAVESAVAIEYWDTDVARERWTGDDESFAHHRLYASQSYVRHLADAELAEDVLTAREARTPGHGATVEVIAKIKASKYKSARKEWFN